MYPYQQPNYEIYGQIPMIPQTNQANNTTPQQKYFWERRSGKFSWDLAESLDVDQIQRTGDLSSVLFYLEKFVHANLTNDDMEQFGSKAALNVFLVMQLGADYLLNQINQQATYTNYLYQQSQVQNQQAHQQLVNQYNENVSAMTKELNQQKYTNSRMTLQINQLNKEIEDLKHSNKRLKQKLQNEKELHALTKERVKTSGEPGAVVADEEFRDLQRIQSRITEHSDPRSIRTSRFTDEGQLSEGEIDTKGLTSVTSHISRTNQGDFSDEY